MYVGYFSNWKDVTDAFDTQEREPTQVLFAGYANEDYSGDAFVLYRKGRKFFTVEGSHCSCYGLEGQWRPEEYRKRDLIAALQKRGELGSLFSSHRPKILEALGVMS